MIKIIQKPLTNILTLVIILFLASCQENQKKEVTTTNAPSQIISISQARDMYSNYTQRRVSLIQKYEDSINKELSTETKFDVARFVSYDYETIKQYLAYIEKEASKTNIELSTLRFYFSNYPNKHFDENKDSILHPRQNSIMISPTIKKEQKDYLFYIGGAQDKQEAILLSDNFEEIKGVGNNKSNKNKSHASIIPNFATPNPIFFKETSVTLNRGHSTPPPPSH